MFWNRKKENTRQWDLIPSLAVVVKEQQLDPSTLDVAIPEYGDEKEVPLIKDRNEIWITDAKSSLGTWRISSLSEMFRGSKEPPADMEHYPEEYCEVFFAIERHVLMVSELISDPTDDEFLRLYNLMKRRTDGRSEGLMHDVIYQSAALMLGLRPISQAEFEAVLNQLARSARNWREGYSSRNYISYLRENFGGIEENPGKKRLLERIKHSDHFFKKTVILDPPPDMGKMSAIILDFAKPLLDVAENNEDMKTAVSIAILVWNSSLLPKKEQEEMTKMIIETTSEGGFENTARDCVHTLRRRKEKYFSGNTRFITDYECTTAGNNFHLNVVSTPSMPVKEEEDSKSPDSK